MELHFLGTGSAYPTPKRSSSCTVFRYEQGLWIFDCGEGAQIQSHKTTLKFGKTNAIFITHLHGDHMFGLPGLLCTISMFVQDTEYKHINIYGPKGLASFIRMSLGITYALLNFKFQVHEILIPEEAGFPNPLNNYQQNLQQLKLDLHPNELPSATIEMKVDEGHYYVCHNDGFTVKAALLNHTIPSLGYALQEDPLPGKLNVSILKEIGVPKGPLFGKLKNGESIEIDGRIITPEMCLGPQRPGRKIVILGDTCNSDNMLQIGNGCDILVHECTNENKDKEKALSHGHSYPEIVGSFASSLHAKKLVLTHFSQRYRTSQEECREDENNVLFLADQTKETFTEGEVLAAEDLYVLQIPLPEC